PDGHFNFSPKAPADGMQYEVDLEPLMLSVLRHVLPRLLKKEVNPPVFLKVDWDKWQNEDDEDDGFGHFGDMDFSNLDMGGGDHDDREIEYDDEDIVTERGSNVGDAPSAAGEEAKP
ncbi:hypothetical protein ZWY2020_060118, partial [Hordeum vulgare]